RAAARLEYVGHVQESRAFQADVEECRLHAGKHAGDAAEADVAGEPSRARTLDVQLLDRSLLHDGDARFVRRVVDQDLFGHRVPAPRSNRAVSYRGRPMIPE